MKILVAGNHNHYTEDNVEFVKETEELFTIKSDEGIEVKHIEHENFNIEENDINMGFIMEADPFSEEIQRLRD